MEYWKSLLERHTKVLKNSGNEDYINHQIITNNIHGAMKTLLKQEEFEDAKLIQILSDSKVFTDPLSKHKPISEPIDPKNTALSVSPAKFSKESINELYDIAHKESEHLFNDGETVLSACAKLAVNDIDGALTQLIRGGELFIAFSVATLLKSERISEISFLLGHRAERLGMLDFANKFYEKCYIKQIIQYFAIRNSLDRAKYGLNPPESYDAKSPDILKNTENMLLAGKIEDAANLAADFIEKVMNTKKYDEMGIVIKLINLLQNVSVGNIGPSYFFILAKN